MRDKEIKYLKDLKKKLAATLTAGVMAINMAAIANAEDKSKTDTSTQTTFTQEVSKPINVQNLDKKKEKLKTTLEKVENLEIVEKYNNLTEIEKQDELFTSVNKVITDLVRALNNERILNATVRVLNLDFVEHDGLDLIEELTYQSVIKLMNYLSNINEFSSEFYVEGTISKIYFIYIPSSVCKKSNREFMDKFIVLSEEYIKELSKGLSKSKEYFNNTMKLLESEEFKNLNPMEKQVVKTNISGPMMLAVSLLDNKEKNSKYSIKYANTLGNIINPSYDDMIKLIRLSNIEEANKKLQIQEDQQEKNSTNIVITSPSEITVDDVPNPKSYQIAQEINQGYYDECFIDETIEERKKKDENPPTGLDLDLAGVIISGGVAFLSRKKKEEKGKTYQKRK